MSSVSRLPQGTGVAGTNRGRWSVGRERHPGALIRGAEHAAGVRAVELFGPGVYLVKGRTERGCCVHLTVHRDDRLLARWRYELDGRIRPEQRGSTAPRFPRSTSDP